MFFINITCKNERNEWLKESYSTSLPTFIFKYKLMLVSKFKMAMGLESGSFWQNQTSSNCHHCVLWDLGHLFCPLEEQEIMRNSHELEEFVGVASLEGSSNSTGCHSTMIWHFQWGQSWNLSAMPESGGGKKIGTIHEVKILECIKPDFKEKGRAIF